MIKLNIEITGDNVASIQSDIAKLLSARITAEPATVEKLVTPAPKVEKPAAVEKPVAEKPAAVEKPTAAPKAEKPAAVEKPSGASLEDLRALGMKLISASRSAELKTVVTSFGATSISTLPADKYEEAKTKLEELLSV